MQISILITTYNSEKYILQALDSIVEQTYKNYEVVIVDDGSQDQTVRIINNYIISHTCGNFRLFPTSHIGRAQALGYAVSLAKYDWVAILDSDDLWNRYKLELQVKCILDKNLEFLSTTTILFGENVPKIDQFPVSHGRAREIALNKMLLRNYVAHSSVVFKKSLALYDINRMSQIDLELWLRILEKKLTRIYCLEQQLTYHRIHKCQSFEATSYLKYGINWNKLGMRYSLRTRKFLPLLFHVAAIMVYFLFNKIKRKRYI